MTQQGRNHLYSRFSAGDRPTEQDFTDVFDSFLHHAEDGLTIENGNLVLEQGLTLGNREDEDRVIPGALRFNLANSQIEYANGSEWVGLNSGGDSVFQQIDNSNSIVFSQGNVGIGNIFNGDSPPTRQLEVASLITGIQFSQARFGSIVCGNGTGGLIESALLAHQGFFDERRFAFSQDNNGNVRINVREEGRISLSKNGSDTRLLISEAGNVIIGEDPADEFPQHVLQVLGTVYKSDGNGNWDQTSDLRVKDNVRDLEAGLDQLMQVNPVRFRYNGKAGTTRGTEGVGVIGQEIETIFPEMVRKVPHGTEFDGTDPLRIYNGSALTYVLVNAVKELANRVQQLEAELAEVRREQSSS